VFLLPFLTFALSGLFWWKTLPTPDECRGGITLLVLTKRASSFNNADLWDAWVKDAFDWSRQELPWLCPRALDMIIFHPPPNGTLETEAFLSPTMRKVAYVDKHPVACRWGHTTPCMHRALEIALQKSNPTTEFFIYVSSDSIPLKPIRVPHRNLNSNPRSRFSISDIDFMTSMKHEQWVILNRKHAVLLVANKKAWTSCKSVKFNKPQIIRNVFAADDEIYTGRTLDLAMRPGGVPVEVTDSPCIGPPGEWGQPRNEQFFLEINNGLIPPAPKEKGSSWIAGTDIRTFVCWKDRGFDGGCDMWGLCGKRMPGNFAKMYEKPFQEKLVQNETWWFARKFDSPHVHGRRVTVVLDDGMEVDMAEYMGREYEMYGNEPFFARKSSDYMSSFVPDPEEDLGYLMNFLNRTLENESALKAERQAREKAVKMEVLKKDILSRTARKMG